VRDLSKLVHLARDFPRFLRQPLEVEHARGIIQRRLATREQRFVRIAERAIYDHPNSPYLQLLKAAGCELGDLRALVSREGLEGALERLDEAGVYVTLDEFKGRNDVVRGSRRFSFGEDDFDNPTVFPHIEAYTGGTRSPGTSVKMSLPYFADLAINTAPAFAAHQLLDHEHAIWLQGFTPGLIYAKLGRLPLAWFYLVGPLPTRIRLASWYMAMLGRLSAHPLPTPAFLDLQQPERLARWLADRLRRGSLVCVTTYASSAVRVCLAARECSLELDGVWFITLGEPFTEAKRRAVEAVGARALVRYAFTEAGIIGYGCANPSSADDLHFFDDSYGLIRRSRPLRQSDLSVDALRFTTLLGTAPKILVNVESGDTAQLQARECGCSLGATGLRQHLADIRSFEKLSGEGTTFVQVDLLRALEDVLPARFGGTSADYQVLEYEDDQGILRLLLLVSPRVGPVDEGQLRQTFLDELSCGGAADRQATKIWRRAGTVEVRRAQPVATTAGKVLPFHLVQASVPQLTSSAFVGSDLRSQGT
jgi:hypothetical protein